jgi:CRP-like cAMP-binding protein
MLAPSLGTPFDNVLFSAVPRAQYDLLIRPHLTSHALAQGSKLLESGEEFDQVYFPHNGMISLLVVLNDGKSIETATMGREGVVGAMAGLGLYKSLVRVVVQLPMGSQISSSQFRKAAAHSDAILALCVRYNEVMLTQARSAAACNALHPVKQQFCRWLLQSADRAGGDTIALTQDPQRNARRAAHFRDERRQRAAERRRY